MTQGQNPAAHLWLKDRILLLTCDSKAGSYCSPVTQRHDHTARLWLKDRILLLTFDSKTRSYFSPVTQRRIPGLTCDPKTGSGSCCSPVTQRQDKDPASHLWIKERILLLTWDSKKGSYFSPMTQRQDPSAHLWLKDRILNCSPVTQRKDPIYTYLWLKDRILLHTGDSKTGSFCSPEDISLLLIYCMSQR